MPKKILLKDVAAHSKQSQKEAKEILLQNVDFHKIELKQKQETLLVTTLNSNINQIRGFTPQSNGRLYGLHI